MMAGAVAGITEHATMYPLDTIRTRAQALGHPGQQVHCLVCVQTVELVGKNQGLNMIFLRNVFQRHFL